MKKIIIALCFLLSFLGVNAQGGWLKPSNSYGTIENRRSVDSTLFYPTGCGTPSLQGYNLRKSAFFYDSCNHRLWAYDPKLSAWDSVHLGLLVTTFKGQNPASSGNIDYNLYRRSDSVFYKINTNEVFAYKDSAAAGTSITSLNGLTGATQTFAVGTSGTNFNISSSGTTHTFNIPDASATARGLITTSDQIISGNKTFGGTVKAEYFYIGSLSGASSTDSLVTINYSTGEVKRLNRDAFISPSQLSSYDYTTNGIALSAGVSSYSLPSGKLLEKVEIIEPSSIYVNIGTTVGGSQIATGVPVTTGYANFTINHYATSTQTIYFSNTTGSTVLKLYIR